jgi:signal transduction histidine kinase
VQHSTSQNRPHHLGFNGPLLDSYVETDHVPSLRPTSDGISPTGGEIAGGREPLSPSEYYFSQQTKSGQQNSHDILSNLLRTTFSRASNLIKEGMDVDGVVYVDAPVGFYQDHNNLGADLHALHDPTSETGSSSADEDYVDVRPSPTSTSGHGHSVNSYVVGGHHPGQFDHASGEAVTLKSDVLGFSTQKHSSLNGDNIQDTDAFTAIDQNLLTSLIRRYPEGKLFTFDHRGPINHKKTVALLPRKTTVNMKHKRDRHKARKRAEIIRLLAVFPGARQIFFVPLYDSLHECFIGSFTWSTSDTRIFSTENDLSYLIAFGHSVMTEVSRLNSVSADRAKDQFINNVSHELRSPLHGILASAEFLADTSMDGFQRSLVDTVDGCGRTLLDTIEHILDFSKIKKFGQGTKYSMGAVAKVDISAIIEEVLEGVYAGFEFNGLSSHGLADMTKSRTRDASETKNTPLSRTLEIPGEKDAVTIILDIDFREHWKFLTVPGTWRRLTMNLFGNALKYTSAGWIKVKLEARDVSPVNLPQNDAKETTMVILTISDSGKGISGEFMKTKLFMPFSQV